MKEKILVYVRKLSTAKNIKKVIEDLVALYEQYNMYDLLAPTLVKLSNNTSDFKIYEKIADIYHFRLRNFDEALNFYNKYLQNNDLDFYKKYSAVIKHLGFNKVEVALDLTEDNVKFRDLCDRFDLLISIMLFLHKLGEYGVILDLKPYLVKFRNKIIRFMKTHRLLNMSYKDDSKKSENYLAYVLSKTKNNIELNRFAIELLPTIKSAYINILEDYISNKKYSETIDFYNKFYAPSFKLVSETSVEAISWHISEYYASEGDYYTSILYKKLSCEMCVGES